jgi:putative aminopeptidase FrvX
MLMLFSETLAAPAPSGREARLAQVIREKLDAWDYRHYTDGAGNVLVPLDGRQSEAGRVCLAAHMDDNGCPIPPGAPLKLDGRPGIWSKDTRTHYDQRLVRDLCRAAKEAGTESQPVVYTNAASNAGLVYSVGGAQRIACLGHVRENSHGYEVVNLAVFDSTLKTLIQLMATWEG